jgi:POT family proton-dependent oligopeptide transporter
MPDLFSDTSIFMVLLYLLHTIGELALSPVGLSLVTKLSPKQMVGFMMGIWFLSSSIAHQGGKHIAKLTTVNEKTIVESKTFSSAKIDESIKNLILKEEFKSQLEDGSIEGLLTSQSFVDELNKISDEKYAVSNYTVKELEEKAQDYKGNKKDKMMKAAKVKVLCKASEVEDRDIKTEQEYAEILGKSPAQPIVSVIKGESLNKGLSVFGLLGWVAAGCGILLFLLGGVISKWMHGVK